MNIPRQFRKQFAAYERAGFRVREIDVNAGKGSHIKAIFCEFSEPQWLTMHVDDDPRSIRNNIARFRRLARDGRG